MPSAEQLTLYQAQRRSTLVGVLAGAGWQPDNAMWDAGLDTDFVATMTLPRPAGTLRCDYVITGAAGDGLGPGEYLSLRWSSTGTPTVEHLVVDFLGQTRGGPDRLAEVLDVLVAARPDRFDDPFDIGALAGVCPIFVVGPDGRLAAVGGGAPNEDGDTVAYADEVEARMHRKLVPAGWLRSPDESILRGVLETFYLDNGSVRLSTGRCNGEETLVRIDTGEVSVHLRVDAVHRPEHADRLIALLLHWQERITPKTCPRLVAELAGSYARVYAEDDDGTWRRLRPAGPARRADPPAGNDQRTELVRSKFAQAGWTPVAGSGHTPVSVCVRNRRGVTLRVDHVLAGLDGLAEALTLSVRLADGTGGRFGGAVTLALDMFDLHSGRGDRDRTHDVIEAILNRSADLDAEALPTMVRALQLCCPVLLVDTDGALRPLPCDPVPAEARDLPLPAPRPLEEVDRLLAAGAGEPAGLWFERGLAALAEDRPDLARDSFDEAIRAEPDLAPAYLQRALLIGSTDLTQATGGLLRCAELGYAPSLVLARCGRLLFSDGHLPDGLAVFRRLTDTLPEYGEGWYERALAAFQQGRYDESVTAGTAAVNLLPDNADALYLRARALARTGQPERALADVDRALTLDGSLRPVAAADLELNPLRGDDRFATLVGPGPVSSRARHP